MTPKETNVQKLRKFQHPVGDAINIFLGPVSEVVLCKEDQLMWLCNTILIGIIPSVRGGCMTCMALLINTHTCYVAKTGSVISWVY